MAQAGRRPPDETRPSHVRLGWMGRYEGDGRRGIGIDDGVGVQAEDHQPRLRVGAVVENGRPALAFRITKYPQPPGEVGRGV